MSKLAVKCNFAFIGGDFPFLRQLQNLDPGSQIMQERDITVRELLILTRKMPLFCCCSRKNIYKTHRWSCLEMAANITCLIVEKDAVGERYI